MRPAFSLAALLPLLVACSEAPRLELDSRAFDVIGGLPAPSPELDHTGALVYRVRASGATGVLCSATLIGPETLVTARHCTVPLVVFERIGIDVSWARGPDSTNPLEQVSLAAFAGSPLTQGGAFGYGSDVAVIHLDRPMDVVPAVVEPFSPELLGKSMITLGFGVASAAGTENGLRRIGRETVGAVEGNIYEALLGDFESFVEWSLTGLKSDADALALLEADPTRGDLDALRLEYESSVLLAQHEAVTGTSPGDTQSCEGDSGSPLARIGEGGRFVTYAVVSGGIGSNRSMCDFGQVFATFGPVTYPFVKAAADWTDPCGDVDAQGECVGSLARRCETSFANGVRRIVEEPCSQPLD